MSWSRRISCIALTALVGVSLITDPGHAQETAAPGIEEQLAQGRSLLTLGSYDEAIELLGGVIEESRGDAAALRETYLLLIKSYFIAGNYYRFRARGAVTSDLYYQKADELILECLMTEGLRHTEPDPPAEYPPEMLSAFERVRAANFGSLRLIELDPPEATVLLDDATVKRAGEAPLPDLRDLTAGPHRIVVRAEGYQERTEMVDIAPGSMLERAYTLEKRKGLRWWALRVGGAVAAGTAVALVSGGGDNTPSSLPGAPDPPP